MVLKTAPIKDFVEEILSTLPGPHGEDVINEVFLAIDADPELRQEYEALSDEFSKDVVNQFGGLWIAKALGRHGVRQVSSNCSLIGSYSKLE
jgi:hypothetical protein